MEQESLKKFLNEVEAELNRAREMHKPINSLHEGYAILLEEVDELWDKIKEKRDNLENIQTELIQIAAMAARITTDVLTL